MADGCSLTLFSFVYLFLICRRLRPENTREMRVKSVPKIFSACKHVSRLGWVASQLNSMTCWRVDNSPENCPARSCTIYGSTHRALMIVTLRQVRVRVGLRVRGIVTLG